MQGNYENIYRRETPVKEGKLSIRQHKKDGDDNSRSAKYEKKKNPNPKKPKPQTNSKPRILLSKKE